MSLEFPNALEFWLHKENVPSSFPHPHTDYFLPISTLSCILKSLSFIHVSTKLACPPSVHTACKEQILGYTPTQVYTWEVEPERRKYRPNSGFRTIPAGGSHSWCGPEKGARAPATSPYLVERGIDAGEIMGTSETGVQGLDSSWSCLRADCTMS